ncbi:MAG: hypothetical protein HY999_00155 [Nitrospinae bacterium]|nr:hypothetical protein [Nitrospinota bacterium]
MGIKCIFILVISLVVFIMMGNVLYAEEIHGTTDFYYHYLRSKSDGDTSDDWRFIHSYSLDWRERLTSTIDLSADIRATLNNTEDKESSDLSPSFLLRMSNDLFSSNLGYRYSAVDPEEGDNRSSKIYSMDLISRLDEIPSFGVSYNKGENFTLGHITNQNSNFNITSGYGYRFFNLRYDYTRGDSEEIKAETSSKSDRHFGTIDLSESFLKNKINLSGRYGILHSSIKDSSKKPTNFLDELDLARGLFTDDPTPVITDPPEITNTPSLIDKDKASSTGITIKTSNKNIGVDLGDVKRVNKVYIYITSIGSPNQSDFKWDIYKSKDGISWDSVSTNNTFGFDPTNSRFYYEDSTGIETRYFKVVNKNQVDIITNDIYITEIEVLSYLSIEKKTELESNMLRHEIGFNANFQPIERIGLSYNLFYETSEREPIFEAYRNEPRSQTTFQLLQGTNLSTKLHRYLSSLVSYQTLLQHSVAVRTGMDSYSLQFTSSPLETLRSSLTLNRSESTEESIIQSRGDSAVLSISSNPYYGVDLGLDFLISGYKDFSGTKTTTKSISTDINLDLTKEIRVTTYSSVTWQSGRESQNIYILRPTFNYRISENLYLIITEDLRGNDDFELGSNFNANWHASQDLQFTIGYNRQDWGDTTSENINSTISWNISRYLVLRLGYNRSIQENNIESKIDTFTTRLSTRF